MASFSFALLAAELTESWPTDLVLPGLRPDQLAPAVRRFLAMSGAQVPFGNASIGAAYVWDRLLRGGIRVLDIDAPLASRGDAGVFAGSWHYSADELAETAGLSVRELPRRLWELHNGGPEGAMALQSVKDHGGQVIDQAPRPGSRGTTVAFVHPKGAFGTLIELVEE